MANSRLQSGPTSGQRLVHWLPDKVERALSESVSLACPIAAIRQPDSHCDSHGAFRIVRPTPCVSPFLLPDSSNHQHIHLFVFLVKTDSVKKAATGRELLSSGFCVGWWCPADWWIAHSHGDAHCWHNSAICHRRSLSSTVDQRHFAR